MILSLLPLKTDKCKVEYKYQMESLEEINEIINSTFGKSKKLNLEEFQNTVENQKSDIFIQIICFLYQKKPFTEKNISVLKSSKKVIPNDLILQTPQMKNKDSCGNILLPSPLKNTSLSPASIFLKSNMIRSPFSLGESAGIEEESEPAISGFNGMVRYHNRNIPKSGGNEDEDNNDVNKIIKNSDGVYNSPSVYLKRHKAKAVTPFSLSSPSPMTFPQSSKKVIPAMSLNEESKDLFSLMKASLPEVKNIKFTNKLKNHPVCLSTEGNISLEMEKILNQMPTGEQVKADVVLEINKDHPIVNKLNDL